MKKIKVRFNLGAGKHFMKWKIEGPLGVEYHDPNKVQLILHNCQLKNNKKTAQKIFDGVHKTVCAWVLCDSISINHLDTHGYEVLYGLNHIKYNPRVEPNWTLNDCNCDNFKIKCIISTGNKLFTY
jgi:hypothetical protein